jgi:hypothetical protein
MGDRDSVVGEIEIEDSIVGAYSAGFGAGIGDAICHSGISAVGKSSIAVIGGSYSWNGDPTATTVSIVKGVIVSDSIGRGVSLGGASRIATSGPAS